MGRLVGKVAVVTGASKGIGAAIARALAAEGASVVVNYASSAAGAETVVSEITERGGRAVAIQADVAQSADVERLFAEATDHFGQIDILVNNAGIYGFAPIEEIDEANYRRHFDVNVLGLLLATKTVVKQFGPAGGSIINISSAITRLNPPGSAVYTATKSSVDAITRVLAKELGGRKIRVNAINPGIVETEGTVSGGIIGNAFETQLVQQTPLGRTGIPGDIAPVAVFLASDEAHWVTGETLAVSGGL